MHRCQHDKAPRYIVDCCTPATDVVGRRRLRSATQQLMVVPRHRLSTVGRRAFAVHGPTVWNSLPDDLRTQQDVGSFKQGSFQGTSIHSALETFATIALYKLTYTIPYHTIPYRVKPELNKPSWPTAKHPPTHLIDKRAHSTLHCSAKRMKCKTVATLMHIAQTSHFGDLCRNS